MRRRDWRRSGRRGSDGGSRPPLGSARPLPIVGLTADGLVSATTIGMAARNWSTLQVEALQDIGTDLAGVKLGGHNILQVIEDMGRGLSARIWTVSGTPTTNAVLVFFSGETGRVVLRGTFTRAYAGGDPGSPRAKVVRAPGSGTASGATATSGLR